MTRPARPRRQRKADRLLHPDATAAEIECDYGVAPFDRLVEELDAKWGIDRLPELVSPELAAKYGAALAQLNDAIRDRDPARCAHKAAVCMKGLRKMDEEAEAAGHPKADPGIIECDLDGWKFGIMTDARAWKAAPKATYPVFSLREIGNALKERGAAHPMVEAAKAAFPGSEVIDWNKELEDDLPF